MSRRENFSLFHAKRVYVQSKEGGCGLVCVTITAENETRKIHQYVPL